MRRLQLLSVAFFLALSTTACDQLATGPTPDISSGLGGLAVGLASPAGPGAGAGAGAQAIPAAFDMQGIDCTFSISGSVMRLDDDCTTDETIYVADGFTLDGRGHSITAVDPGGGSFDGPVVTNAGAEAHVKKLTVTASGLSNVCDGGADRLRGIMFEGASGSITHNTVTGINQGPSGCQEGNAVEIRNAPFDGTHPATVSVEVAHNVVDSYQKTGIVANGDVDVDIHHNDVDESATQDNLAANSVQCGFGAICVVAHNNVEGNQWKGLSNFAASGILVFSGTADVSNNNVRGNSDVGVFAIADGGTYANNRVFDIGDDHPNSGYDIGMGLYGAGNTAVRNQVRDFTTPFDGFDPGKTNKSVR